MKEGFRKNISTSVYGLCCCSHAMSFSQQCNKLGDLVKQVRTPPVRPADGVVGGVYESFVPGEWHRWLEKEILLFSFLGRSRRE